MNPSNVLAIETATDICSVALLQDGRVTTHLNLTRPRSHAALLTPLIREALELKNLAASALDAVAVSMGPGSYTGLRIGVSTAKGLAMAAEASLLGISSLEALASGATAYARPGTPILATFQARRNEVYAAAFWYDAAKHLKPLTEPTALTLDALAAWLPDVASQQWLLTGNGTSKITPLLDDLNAIPYHVLPESVNRPSAVLVGLLAQTHLENGAFHDITTFEPFYLKAFIARKNKRSVFERLPF